MSQQSMFILTDEGQEVAKQDLLDVVNDLEEAVLAALSRTVPQTIPEIEQRLVSNSQFLLGQLGRTVVSERFFRASDPIKLRQIIRDLVEQGLVVRL